MIPIKNINQNHMNWIYLNTCTYEEYLKALERDIDWAIIRSAHVGSRSATFTFSDYNSPRKRKDLDQALQDLKDKYIIAGYNFIIIDKLGSEYPVLTINWPDTEIYYD